MRLTMTSERLIEAVREGVTNGMMIALAHDLGSHVRRADDASTDEEQVAAEAVARYIRDLMVRLRPGPVN